MRGTAIAIPRGLGLGLHCYACSERARRFCCRLLRARLTLSGRLTPGFRCLARTEVGAALLCELGTCQAVLFPITPGALEGVRVLNRRTSGLPSEASLRFCCEGRSVLLRVERALCVSIDYDDPPRSWHFELEICIMCYHIESCECG